MLWRLPGLLLRRTLRTMLLLTWLAAGAQGYGFDPLVGFDPDTRCMALGTSLLAQTRLGLQGRDAPPLVGTAPRARLPPVVAGAHMRLLAPPVYDHQRQHP